MHSADVPRLAGEMTVIGVWRVSLRPDVERLAVSWRALDRDEQARARAFRFDSDRCRYVLAHGALRSVLSTWLGVDPRALRFAKGPAGKPHIDGLPATDVEFNLSHSGDLGLIAVTANRPVGVDVEEVRPDFDYAAIADRYYSSEERARLEAVEPFSTYEFFRLWTRKEAHWKATGLGMAAALDGGEPSADAWTVRDVPVASGYAAAVCAPGSDWQLRCFPCAEDA